MGIREVAAELRNKNLGEFAEEIEKVTAQEFPWDASDDLLRGFTYQDLIDTVYSNEEIRDEKAVRKVFDEIRDSQLRDARSMLRHDMKKILKVLNEEDVSQDELYREEPSEREGGPATR